MEYEHTPTRARLAAACLMMLTAVPPAFSAERPKPAREAVEASEAASIPTLRGNLLHPGSGDLAMLMHTRQSGMDLYGLVVVPNAASGQPPRVVKNFTDKGPNPPRLSLVKPGTYTPVCHDGGQCAPVKIANEAISLCFGEASCEIVYFDGSAFRELAVTD